VEAAGAPGEAVIALLTDGLRVVRADRQWIIQQRSAKTWSSFAYCATKEGLLLRLRDHLLKGYLSRLDSYTSKEEKTLDPKRGVLKSKRTVSREMLDVTSVTRAALKRGDVARFGIEPKAWAVIEALPDYFPK